jgi:arylsulfatase
MKRCPPLLIALLLLRVAPLDAAQATSAKPNIIVILVDDMGFSDLGCYGSEIETPNLDRLAANGLRFTQFYNSSRCCPTRAALLTGLYPPQAGLGNMTKNQGLPAYQGHLNDQCVTLAEVLKGAGYFTAMAGKWHLGGDEFTVTPWKRGFDHGLSSQHGGFYYVGNDKENKPGKASPLWLDGKNLPGNSPEIPKNSYTTDLFTDYGIKYIDQALEAKKPFFLYLAHTAPHWPLQAPPEDIAKYRGKYNVGWDKLRERRYRWQIQHDIIDPAWSLSPLPKGQAKIEDVPAWDSLNETEKDRYDHIMAIYAATVDHLDQSIGRLVDALKQRQALDNTLIVFLSDNGGSAEGKVEGKLTEGKKDSGPVAWLGAAWATLSNTPFGYYKHFAHEGGIATPFIAHWPDGIKNGGSLCKERAHIIDLMATCVDIAGAKYPTEFNGRKILPMEGKSIAPAFTGGAIGHGQLCWEHNGQCAILEGDWKLVCVGSGEWELYDLTKDRTELQDLAAKEPARVKDLAAKWTAWANRTEALPKPNKQEAKDLKKESKQGKDRSKNEKQDD